MTDSVSRPSRRRWLGGALAAAGAGLLAACDRIVTSPVVQQSLRMAHGLTYRAQRLIVPREALAPEYAEADISPDFRANGSTNPMASDYVALRQGGFADYRLIVDGLVERPLSLSLAELRARPSRTQITKHDCVEGWTSIGKWKGTPLSAILEEAGLRPEARYIVFYCFDALDQREDGDRYYESIDLVDAYHPQTILAYEMNDRILPVPHGAPLRLRVERQIGYKHAK